MPSQRKPLSGHLMVRIHAVADVDHASTSRFSRGPETFVIMKVEDNFKGRTKATRTDRWTDEQHDFDIDKANEIELTVYDKSGEHPQPIGMLWVRISDIAEEMRRKRIETEFTNAGWISADKMGDSGQIRPDLQFQPPPTSQSAGGNGGGGGGNGGFQAGPNPGSQVAPIMIDDWFSLEPVGKIRLTLSFGEHVRDLASDLSPQLTFNSSQANKGAQKLRPRSWKKGRHSPKEGRSRRASWSQVCPTDILQHHALRALWRLSQIHRWYAMC